METAMRKVILMMLLAVVTNSAMAKWAEVGATALFTAYVDSATIQKAGNRVKMWDLFDFNITQTLMDKQFHSIKSQREFDCKETTMRLIYTTSHTLRMGAGNIVYTSNSVRDWAPVPPESIKETLNKYQTL
jgi:hypothetical protein